MSVAFDELMNEEEMYSESIRKANDRYMECLRRGPSPPRHHSESSGRSSGWPRHLL